MGRRWGIVAAAAAGIAVGAAPVASAIALTREPKAGSSRFSPAS